MSSEGAEAASDNFDAIEKAVMESRRGRWFLDEYARRRSGGDTKTVLTAIGKLENAVAANQDLIAERLGKALGLITIVDGKLSSMPTRPAAPPVELTQHHMKFFKQDEELFEAPAKPAAEPCKITEPKPEATKGAKLVIRRQPEPVTENETTSVELAIQPHPMAKYFSAELAAAPTPAVEASPKSRIVIIRHKAGEAIDVPLHDEIRASA